MSADSPNKEILFQYIMNYKAHRRAMIPTRIGIATLIAGGLAGFCALNIPLGIVLAAMALCIGAITVVASLNKECSYTVFDTSVLIKSKDRRVEIPLDGLLSVKFKRAFYEKDLYTGTVTLAARTAKGGKRTYKLRHIFDAESGVAFLTDVAAKNAAEQTK